MSTCPHCGRENQQRARFCAGCGAALEAPDAAAAMPPTTPEPAAPPQAVQPPYPQPAPPPGAYQPPPPGAYEQQQYAPPPAPPYQGAYYPRPAQAARRKGTLFWVGAAIVAISGALVLLSTWLSWGAGSGGYFSLSGWDWFDLGKTGGGGPGDVVNAFFVYSDSYLIFTGLGSLIMGALILLAGALMLVLRSKVLGGMAIFFAVIALGMAIVNLTTILRTEGITVGAGMIVFLAFALAALLGGVVSVSG